MVLTIKQMGKVISLLEKLDAKINDGDVFERDQIIDEMIKRQEIEYMLDFIIWKFVQNNVLIANVEVDDELTNAEKQDKKWSLMKQ